MYEMGDLENIMLEEKMLKSIDDPTHQGIDLIFKNNTPPPEIVIVESKFKSSSGKPKMNKNRNENTKHRWERQMDDDWIDINLKKAVGDDKAKEIKALLKQDIDNFDLNGEDGEVNILKLATKISPNGSIKYFKIDRDGNVTKELSKIEVEQILKN